jgi:hypothetical protein
MKIEISLDDSEALVKAWLQENIEMDVSNLTAQEDLEFWKEMKLRSRQLLKLNWPHEH